MNNIMEGKDPQHSGYPTLFTKVEGRFPKTPLIGCYQGVTQKYRDDVVLKTGHLLANMPSTLIIQIHLQIQIWKRKENRKGNFYFPGTILKQFWHCFTYYWCTHNITCRFVNGSHQAFVVGLYQGAYIVHLSSPTLTNIVTQNDLLE